MGNIVSVNYIKNAFINALDSTHIQSSRYSAIVNAINTWSVFNSRIWSGINDATYDSAYTVDSFNRCLWYDSMSSYESIDIDYSTSGLINDYLGYDYFCFNENYEIPSLFYNSGNDAITGRLLDESSIYTNWISNGNFKIIEVTPFNSISCNMGGYSGSLTISTPYSDPFVISVSSGSTSVTIPPKFGLYTIDSMADYNALVGNDGVNFEFTGALYGTAFTEDSVFEIRTNNWTENVTITSVSQGNGYTTFTGETPASFGLTEFQTLKSIEFIPVELESSLQWTIYYNNAYVPVYDVNYGYREFKISGETHTIQNSGSVIICDGYMCQYAEGTVVSYSTSSGNRYVTIKMTGENMDAVKEEYENFGNTDFYIGIPFIFSSSSSTNYMRLIYIFCRLSGSVESPTITVISDSFIGMGTSYGYTPVTCNNISDAGVTIYYGFSDFDGYMLGTFDGTYTAPFMPHRIYMDGETAGFGDYIYHDVYFGDTEVSVFEGSSGADIDLVGQWGLNSLTAIVNKLNTTSNQTLTIQNY